MGAVVVEEATEVTPELVDAFRRLIPQLSSSSPPPGQAELDEIVGSPGAVVLVARDGAEIVGTLTLVLFRIPTGQRSIIEDVVVDERVRGRRPGVGRLLTEAAIRVAGERGVKTIDLTSRPSRQAANQLYERLGFEPRETNVWRYRLE